MLSVVLQILWLLNIDSSKRQKCGSRTKKFKKPFSHNFILLLSSWLYQKKLNKNEMSWITTVSVLILLRCVNLSCSSDGDLSCYSAWCRPCTGRGRQVIWSDSLGLHEGRQPRLWVSSTSLILSLDSTVTSSSRRFSIICLLGLEPNMCVTWRPGSFLP